MGTISTLARRCVSGTDPPRPPSSSRSPRPRQRTPRAPAATRTRSRSAPTRRRPRPPRARARRRRPPRRPPPRSRRPPRRPPPRSRPPPRPPRPRARSRPPARRRPRFPTRAPTPGCRASGARSCSAPAWRCGCASVSRTELTAAPGEPERAGAELAARLQPGDVVLVSGELGAGKCTFVRGALHALGFDGPVTSPTFVVGHLHEGRYGPLAHLDLYRLPGPDGEDPGLLAPFFWPRPIVFVEWPEHARDAWPPERVAHRVRLAHAGGDRRRIEVE